MDGVIMLRTVQFSILLSCILFWYLEEYLYKYDKRIANEC